MIGWRIRPFDRFGRELREISAPAVTSWMMNEASQTKFVVATNQITAEQIRYRNLVLIERQKLPPWVGVIWPPRTWYGNRTVMVTAVSPHIILQARHLKSAPVSRLGATLMAVLAQANKEENTLISLGEVANNIMIPVDRVNFGTAFNFIKTTMQAVNQWFTIDHYFTPQGYLRLMLNVHAFQDQESGLELKEGFNCEGFTGGGVTMSEEGEFANRIWAYSVPIDGTVQLLNYQPLDTVSRDQFGLLDGVITGVTKNSGWKFALDYTLRQRKQPLKKFNLAVLDHEDALSRIAVGQVVRADFPNVGLRADNSIGFKGKLRIRAMSWSDTEQKAPIVTEEVV